MWTIGAGLNVTLHPTARYVVRVFSAASKLKTPATGSAITSCSALARHKNARPHLACQEPWNRLASQLTLLVCAFDSIPLVLTLIAPKASHARNARTCPTASSGRACSSSDGVFADKTGNMYDEQLKRRVVTVVECPAVSLDLNKTSCKTTPAISLLIAPQTLY